MEIGIIGLPQAGKKTIFNLLTGGNVQQKGGVSVGIGTVRDPRFYKLVDLYRPEKQTPATIRFVLLPKIEKEASQNEDFFKAIAQVDAICLVARAFEDESIFHMEGSIDPLRDIALMNTELILHDLVFIEKRLEKLEKDLKKKADPTKKSEETLLQTLKSHLEQDHPLRRYTFSKEDSMIISGYPLLTRKPLLIVLNISENEIQNQDLLERVSKQYANQDVQALQVSAKIEEELQHLDSSEEKEAFLKELGIQEPAIDSLSRLSFQLVGLISYFTVGEDEVRAWIIKRGSNAQEAAGAIHSDLQRGFIRAELMKYEELIQLGSENKMKESGKFQLKGKEYIVQDGDILSFRCNG